jgi:hypothetical protein
MICANPLQVFDRREARLERSALQHIVGGEPLASLQKEEDTPDWKCSSENPQCEVFSSLRIR